MIRARLTDSGEPRGFVPETTPAEGQCLAELKVGFTLTVEASAKWPTGHACTWAFSAAAENTYRDTSMHTHANTLDNRQAEVYFYVILEAQIYIFKIPLEIPL